MRSATSAAADGVWNGCVTVASSTMSIDSGAMPDAASAMSATVSSAAAKRRSTMPVRSRIHSSDESMRGASSSLVTTRAGR